MTVRDYMLGVDWSRQGHYTGTLEDVTGYVDTSEVVISYGRNTAETTSASTVGRLDFGLRNDGGEFSPENTSSPINGKIWPGTPVVFQKTLGATLHTLFAGELDRLDVDPDAPARTFTGEALDVWGKPSAERLSTEVHQGIRTGAAIEIILDEIGWTGLRDIDPGATYIPYWWEDGTDAATAVQKLVDSEGPPAIAYVHAGTFIFRDRHHRVLRAESTTSQATFAVTIPEPSAPGVFKILDRSFTYDHGLNRLANTAVFEVEQRQATEIEQIWQSDDTIVIAANETHLIDVASGDPFVNAQTPGARSEYTLLSGTFTAALSRTSGQSTLLTLTAGGSGAVIQGMAVYASPVPVASTVKITEEDAGSVSLRGRQTWPDSVPWANVYDAQVIAQKIVATYAGNRPLVTFEITNLDDTYLEQILTRRISDRITIRNDKLGLNSDFVIERITHTIGAKWQIHRVRFHCQVVDPTQPETVFTFDVSGAGFDDGSFGIAGVDSEATMFQFDVAGRGFDDGTFAH